MAILSGIAVLHCQSIETSLDFYQQLLQFVVVNKREVNGQLQWLHLMHGDTTLMLQAENPPVTGLAESPRPKISLYFFVNDINKLHHFIKAKYKKVSDVESTDYKMREFNLLDPEGNTITIGQTN